MRGAVRPNSSTDQAAPQGAPVQRHSRRRRWCGVVGCIGAASACLHGFQASADTLRRLAAQQMPAHHEQIGQCAGHDQAMSVLLQPAIAYLGKAEHPLDDPDRMFDPGPHFGLGTVFRPLDLIHDTAVAVAAIGEILGFWRVLPDHRALPR